MGLPVAILAGGTATRLGAISESVPKLLIETAGEPFLHHQLRLLEAAGLDRVFILGAHLIEKIQAAVEKGLPTNTQVEIISDGETRLGTGGALKAALPRLGGSFFVLYGDSYLDCDYSAIESAFTDSGCDGLMTVCKGGGLVAPNVEMDGGKIAAYNKASATPAMGHVDYGLSLFKASAFDGTPDGEFDLGRVHQDLIARGSLAAYESPTSFHEIGTPEGLKETEDYIRSRSQ